jgi:hypothetical protein
MTTGAKRRNSMIIAIPLPILTLTTLEEAR